MIHFIVHEPSNTSTETYWAECVEFPGCVTQSDPKINTLPDLEKNIREAIDLYLDEPETKYRIGEEIRLVFDKGYREGFEMGFDCCEQWHLKIEMEEENEE